MMITHSPAPIRFGQNYLDNARKNAAKRVEMERQESKQYVDEFAREVKDDAADYARRILSRETLDQIAVPAKGDIKAMSLQDILLVMNDLAKEEYCMVDGDWGWFSETSLLTALYGENYYYKTDRPTGVEELVKLDIVFKYDEDCNPKEPSYMIKLKPRGEAIVELLRQQQEEKQ